MDKISSIIPSNSRISSVDLQEARPLRPGVPSHGQPVGRSEVIRFSKSALETVKEGQRTRSVLEERNVKIADTLAKKFFREKTKDVQTSEPEVAVDPAEDQAVQQQVLVAQDDGEANVDEEVRSPYLGEDLFDSDFDKIDRVSTSNEEDAAHPYSLSSESKKPGTLIDKKA